MTDWDAEIRRLQNSIDHTSPDDHPERVAALHDLGLAYCSRHRDTGDTTDIKVAVKHLQASVGLTAQGHPELSRRLDSLGVGYGLLCQRTGDTADIDTAIRYLQAAVELTPPGHPDRAERLDSLGSGYNTRYYRTGSTADLDKSLEYAREALTIIPPSHPDHARRLNVVGIGYDNRHQTTGNTADINTAIQHLQESVDQTSSDHPEYGRRLHNLGNGYSHRYQRMSNPADLDEAIKHLQRSVDLAPSHHPDHARRLDSLSVNYVYRYERTRNLADLSTAIQHFSALVDLTPRDHADRARRLHNLGICYHHRYVSTDDLVDINESIKHLEESVEQTSSNHTERVERLGGLGAAYISRYNSTHGTADLGMAIDRLAEAIHVTASPMQIRLRYAVKLLLVCAKANRLEEAYKTACAAMPLVPLLTPKFLKNADKQHLLTEVAGFASDSAAIALSVGQDVFEAVQFLELGRGVISGSLIEMRTDVTTLSRLNPELGQEFVRLRDLLDSPETSKNDGPPASESDLSNVRYDAQKKMENLLSDIRDRQGFEDFLLAPKREDVQNAAAMGAIVIINVSQYRCDAILVEQHAIRSVPLTKLSSNDIEKKAQDRDLGSCETLRWMWDAIASPVLEALGLTLPRPDGKWPHVWWIPTGLLTKFPLHAAGRHQESCSETVLDSVISSYGSSIKAIIHRRAIRSSEVLRAGSSQALLVAVPNLAGSRPLQHAKTEVDMVCGVCKTMNVEPIQSGCRKRDVVSHLAQCKIFHFAGHGFTDVSDPSLSSLLLEDGESDRLTVANLLEISARDHLPFLAYLSACGTGEIRDEKLLDESIHLVSAFQLAGFRHVIGTLWEVRDEVCVKIARTTYEGIRDGGMTDESVCLGLHHASRKLRDEWLSKKDSNLRRRSRVRNASQGDDGQVPLGRDFVISGEDDEDEEEEAGEAEEGTLSWVPYVHYGV